ncbi:hypothetical protein M409DRAFT_19758 [Zasmidium cellare ATCC 36951]|uniref:HMG box domain-containing protein n=1 Tax=Zasmidium cellare ATCC 36951 TaxID=1080233 RepID=A0A6A6CWF6_ZASCE|nr:uncharacterized protein M409DRAFT_19758 [Zasmidium cellare ATCC 36951]KAF2170152.1 hypothetical protein M409DRAFT_19758 [Zasmidium cellare ATCC 36951]
MAPPPYPLEKISVVVDKNKFIATRNALTNAFVGLSGAIDTAVKAYVAHTNAVLEEGSSLDVGYLMQPLMNLNNVAQIAQQAILQNGNATPNPQLNPDGTKKKRQYKPRDPNAPKRPLTAYFRFLQEQRPKISAEINARGPTAEGGKAGDISKLATERWNAMTPQLQAPYRAAYQNEMKAYNDAVKVYKAAGGQVEDEDAAAEDDDEITAPPPQTVVAAADPEEEEEEDDDDDDDSSDDDSSEDDEDEEEVPAKPAPVVKPKAEPATPAAAKKTAKSGPKKIKAGADPVEPEPTPASAPAKKRKEPATASEDQGGKKKRGRPNKADQAAAPEPVEETPQAESTPATDKKKDKKKKRKSEGA